MHDLLPPTDPALNGDHLVDVQQREYRARNPEWDATCDLCGRYRSRVSGKRVAGRFVCFHCALLVERGK